MVEWTNHYSLTIRLIMVNVIQHWKSRFSGRIVGMFRCSNMVARPEMRFLSRGRTILNLERRNSVYKDLMCLDFRTRSTQDVRPLLCLASSLTEIALRLKSTRSLKTCKHFRRILNWIWCRNFEGIVESWVIWPPRQGVYGVSILPNFLPKSRFRGIRHDFHSEYDCPSLFQTQFDCNSPSPTEVYLPLTGVSAYHCNRWRSQHLPRARWSSGSWT